MTKLVFHLGGAVSVGSTRVRGVCIVDLDGDSAIAWEEVRVPGYVVSVGDPDFGAVVREAEGDQGTG